MVGLAAAGACLVVITAAVDAGGEEVHGVWPDVEYVVQVLQSFRRQVGLTARLLLLVVVLLARVLLP
jgi:hypothetical protein